MCYSKGKKLIMNYTPYLKCTLQNSNVHTPTQKLSETFVALEKFLYNMVPIWYIKHMFTDYRFLYATFGMCEYKHKPRSTYGEWVGLIFR